MKPFWTILKGFGIVAGAITTMWVLFNFFDGIRDDVVDVKDDVVEIKISQDSLLEITKRMQEKDILNEAAIMQNSKDIRYNSRQSGLVMDSYLEHIKKDDGLTKDEFIEYMEPFLEYIKKNSSPMEYGMTPLVQIRPGDEGSQILSSSH